MVPVTVSVFQQSQPQLGDANKTVIKLQYNKQRNSNEVHKGEKMKNIIEFLNLTQTLLEIDQELKELHSFIKTFSKPKSYKKDEDKKVIPFNNVVQKSKIPIEEYCYEDDDFTYTTDP